MKKLLLRGKKLSSHCKFPTQVLIASVEAVEARQLLSTTYYVSPTGSDTNAGTSPNTSWQTVAKVNASSFSPGDSILFQYGSQFHASLTASSSGTVANPITYGAYGDSTLSNPLFNGSDVVDTSLFTLVTGTTYSMQSTTPINWVYDNGDFMRETQDALLSNGSSQSSDQTTNINYVESQSGFFYYDSSTTTLYVNRGGTFAEHIISLGTRQDAILTNQHDNLIFTNLDVTDTAADNGGYGVRIQTGSNVQVLNSTASFTGKHAFGVINVTGFVGKNLTADQSAPDQGFGGASAFVAFSDATQLGNTSQWFNCTYTNANGPYPVFVSHGDTNSIASILLQNMVSLNGYGTGIGVQTTGANEKLTILGGEMGEGAVIAIDNSNSVIDGVTFKGGFSGIQLSGSDNVVQNCVFDGLDANISSGHNGPVDDEGTNNVIRFNSFLLPTGPAVFIRNADANTAIYANIFDTAYAICLAYAGTGMLTSHNNVFSTGNQFLLNSTDALQFASVTQWQAMGYDTTSVVGNPGFIDSDGGNLQLTASSPAINLFKGTPDATLVAITDDFAGNPRPVGAGYDAGAYEFGNPASPPIATPVSGSISIADTTLAAPLPGTTSPALFTLTLSSAQTVATSVAYTTVDGTAIAGIDYIATSGTINFAAGATTATVSVPVSPTLAVNSSKTFQLVLSSPTTGLTLGTTTATATVSNANQTTVAFNKKTPAIYTDTAGKKVTIKIGGVGSGTALFVSGNADPVQILLTGTARTSTLSITSIGAVTTLQNIVIQGPIASVTTTAALAGTLEITGTVSRLTLGNLNSGSALLLDSAASRVALKLAAATDSTLTSASPITTLTATSWNGSIAAPSIGALSMTGTLGGNVNLSSGGIALASAKLGAISGSAWAITGALGSVSVTGAVTGSTLKTGGNIARISIGAAVDSTFFAGVSSTLTTLPTAITDFTGSSQIGSFVITAPRAFPNAFTDSFVAAAKILSAKVQRVQTANNGTSFGFAAQTLGAFTDVETGKKTFSWTSRKAVSLLTFAGDFKVSVI